MNYWTQKTFDLANKTNYLDQLSTIYSFGITEDEREPIDKAKWKRIVKAYDKNDNESLIKELLTLEKFPINNSYVGYLRKDPESIKRNPQIVFRLADKIRGLSKDELKKKCMEPKSNSRQMGQKFREWLTEDHLGIPVLESVAAFTKNKKDAVLKASDAELLDFARKHFKYPKDKGFDFLARVNGKYVIGEAKFITNDGGSQDKQFEDAYTTAELNLKGAITIGIVDGVPFIDKPTLRKYKAIFNGNSNITILSALLIKEFLDSLR